MRRTETALLTALALLAGCRDDPPAPTAAPETAAPAEQAPTATLRRPSKIRPGAVRALVPGTRVGLRPPDDGGAPDAAAAEPAPAPARVWAFDKDKADEAPAAFDFATSTGKPGKWRVVADPGAASPPGALAQLDTDSTQARFLTAVAAEPSLHDLRVSVRCKTISGKVDQACGLVVRFKDPKNDYVARARSLEKNVNLYVVKDGKRTLLGGWKGEVPSGAWHELRLDAKGDHLETYWDGAKVYEVDDKTFPDPGRIGLWTKSDSVTYFDDLSVTAL